RTRASSACSPWLPRCGSPAAPAPASPGISTRCGGGSPPHRMPGTAPTICLHVTAPRGVGPRTGTGDARAFPRDHPRVIAWRGDHAPLSIPRSALRAVGARALLLRLLADALHLADLGPRMRRKGARTGPGRVTRAQVVAARRWLLGELDDQVALPVGYVCDMLNIDADVLAAVVRARVLAR